MKFLILLSTVLTAAGTTTEIGTELPNRLGRAAAQTASSRAILQLSDGAVAALPAPHPGGALLPPLIVVLHGAGQGPDDMIRRFADDAECADAVILAPKSIGRTWDVVNLAEHQALAGISLASDVLRYTTSKDADRVMAAIATLSKSIKTDPARQILLGFSDGATFALGMGTARDRPFAAVVALSPGLPVVAARPARGRPVLVMHGTKDLSLPFELTRSIIIPLLRNAQLAVRFVPTNGGHAVPENALTVFNQNMPTLLYGGRDRD